MTQLVELDIELLCDDTRTEQGRTVVVCNRGPGGPIVERRNAFVKQPAIMAREGIVDIVAAMRCSETLKYLTLCISAKRLGCHW